MPSKKRSPARVPSRSRRPGSRRGSPRASGTRRRWRRCGAAHAAGNHCPIPAGRAPAWPCRLRRRTSPSSPNRRRPNSTSGTVSMSNTSVFIGVAPQAGRLRACARVSSSRRRLEHGHRDDEPGFVGERDMAVADAQLAPHLLAARRIDHFGLAPRVLHHAHVANPDAVRETRAHGLDDGLLGGESHGEKSLRAAWCARVARVPPAAAGAR